VSAARSTIPVTLIPGDGIGPEVVTAARRIIEATGAPIVWDEQRAGADVFREGLPSGVPDDTIASITETRVALKGPVATPIASGLRSINMALRNELDLFANVRPCKRYEGIPSPYANVDLVVVRENTEGLYAGMEHEVVPGVVESVRLITRPAAERIVRYAFEYARNHGRHNLRFAPVVVDAVPTLLDAHSDGQRTTV